MCWSNSSWKLCRSPDWTCMSPVHLATSCIILQSSIRHFQSFSSDIFDIFNPVGESETILDLTMGRNREELWCVVDEWWSAFTSWAFSSHLCIASSNGRTLHYSVSNKPINISVSNTRVCDIKTPTHHNVPSKIRTSQEARASTISILCKDRSSFTGDASSWGWLRQLFLAPDSAVVRLFLKLVLPQPRDQFPVTH